MISPTDILLVLSGAAFTAAGLIWLDGWYIEHRLKTPPLYLKFDQARPIDLSAKSITLNEIEQIVVKEAMHQLRTNNQLLSQVATEVDLSMNSCAEATRSILSKINSPSTRHLVERATQR